MPKWQFTIKVIGEGSDREDAFANAIEYLAHSTNDGRIETSDHEFLYDDHEAERDESPLDGYRILEEDES